MTASVVANSCRLTIISSTLRVDLAVPMHIAVAELLTIVVSSLGSETADQGAAEGGFVLQRASEAPLDPSASLAASQVRDGDILYLRTRSTNLPEVAFDDVLDAVATGVATRTSRWTDVHTMRAAATFAGALLAFALVVSLLIGPSWTSIAIADGVAAILLVLTASAVGRIYRRRAPALAAGGFAVAFAIASGATSVGGTRSLLHFGSPQLLVAACAAALIALVLVVVLSDGVAGFGAVVTASLLTAIGTGIANATTLSPQGTAAIVATAALAISPFLPTLSFRLSRLPLPLIPVDAADLRRDTSRVDTPQILAQAVRADAYLTGLVGGVALAIAGAAVIISGRGTTEHILTLVLGLICLMRARLFTGLTQRALLLVSGGIALGSELVASLLDAHGTARLLAYVVPAAVVAIVLIGLSVVLPGRRYAPTVARAADLFESLMVLSVIPLSLGVMGVYGAVRHLHTHH